MDIVGTIIVSLVLLYAVIEVRKNLGRVGDEIRELRLALEQKRAD